MNHDDTPKYATVRQRHAAELTRRGELRRPPRKDRWLLVSPDGRIGGVYLRDHRQSATEAFERFYTRKRERRKAAAEGWHIEQDDPNGTRTEAWVAKMQRDREASTSSPVQTPDKELA